MNERDFVTPEQIKEARSVNLLDYLKRYEPDNLIRTAPGEYKLKDHDSLKISNGKFHWFSRGIGGVNAIDYLVKVRGMEFKEAVRELAGGDSSITYEVQKQSRPPPKPLKQDKPQDNGRVLTLPEPDNHNNDAIEYLKGRGIEESIIRSCIENKLLYQSTKQSCVFVGYDGEGSPKFACERGIKSDMKKDVAGSNKAYNFCLPPLADNPNDSGKSARLYVFEGAIDCLSHASIAEIGSASWDGYRLSLGGVSNLALNAFLENHPHINQVYLCLDNDERGNEATERISRELMANESYSHINIYIAPLPTDTGKDFNDTLIFMREKINERKLQTHNTVTADIQKPNADKKRYETTL
jgi:hypothetical protein